MKIKTMKLIYAAIMVVSLFNGCDSSTVSSTQNDITGGTSLTLISHTRYTESFDSNGSTIRCTDKNNL